MWGLMNTNQNDRLRQARIAASYKSAAKAAEAFGWNISTYRHHENGTRGFGQDHARAYGRAFYVSAAWLLGLDDNAEPNALEKIIAMIDTPDEVTGSMADLQNAMFEEIGHVLVHHYQISDFDKQTTTMPLFHNISQDFDYVAYPKILLDGLANVGTNLICSVDAVESAMAPTIKSGARVLVDTGAQDLNEQDAIWLLTVGENSMIRRLVSLAHDKVSIYADGMNRSMEIDRFDIAIRGKVVWIGQTA